VSFRAIDPNRKKPPAFVDKSKVAAPMPYTPAIGEYQARFGAFQELSR